MKLYMKQQLFSSRDRPVDRSENVTNRFYISDEDGNNRFYVRGEILIWGKKLHVFHENGTQTAFICKKIPALRPTFSVEIDGKVVCEIVKEFSLLKPYYRFEGLSWYLKGDFLAHNYSLTDGKRQICRLSKKWFVWGDSYELDVADPNDELLCICTALAVDSVFKAKRW